MILPGKFSHYFFSAPNLLTLSRAVLGLFIPWLILAGQTPLAIAAFFLFILGAVTDYWDGSLARKMNLVSDFGKITDPVADKILILGPLAAFVSLGHYSAVWVVPIFIREILVTFCRIGWLLEGRAVGAEMAGKYKLGTQVALIICSLLHMIVPQFAWLRFADPLVVFLMNATLAAALFLTLFSGISVFIRNKEYLNSPGFAKYTAAAGVGLIPFAPGTWGSLLGLVLAILLQIHAVLYAVVLILLGAAGYWAARRLGLSKGEDPSYVVLDEVCGMMLALMMIPLTPVTVIAGFLLFRAFDILKPFPLCRLEKIPGYWGILADDLGAGACAWLLLKIFLVP